MFVMPTIGFLPCFFYKLDFLISNEKAMSTVFDCILAVDQRSVSYIYNVLFVNFLEKGYSFFFQCILYNGYMETHK